MSKVKKSRFHDEKFTLFPFLDALSGVVGVLALVISSLSLFASEKPKLVFDTPRNRTAKQPHYVECIDGGVVIHPEKTFVTLEQLDEESGVWQQFLNKINENAKSEYAVLLIRIGGFETYNKAFQSVQSVGIDVGREIVAMDGDIEIKQEK